MSGVRLTRALLALPAAAFFGYGGWRLLRIGLPNLWAVAEWMAGGIIVHDAILAPAVVLAGVVLARVLPRWAQAPAVSAGIVLGSVTLVAVPELGRFGAKPDNPSLLDRPYGLGWLGFAALVCLCALAWAEVQRRRARADEAPS